MTSERRDRLGRRVVEVRSDMLALRSEIDGLRGRLRATADEGVSVESPPPGESGGGTDLDAPEPAGSTSPEEPESYRSAAPSRPEQPVVSTGQSDAPAVTEDSDASDAAASDADAPEPDAETAASLMLQVGSQTDDELAETFDTADSFLEDAERRDDEGAVVYWHALAKAVLEEAARRPEFGAPAKDGDRLVKGFGRRRRRRLVERLEQASRSSSEGEGSPESH